MDALPQNAEPAPPSAERKPHQTSFHGIARSDDYAWLRADNWQEVMRDPASLDADIRAYLEAENAYTESRLAGTTDLQDALFAEMKGRIKEDDSSVPAPDGAFAYYTRYEVGGQHPLFCRRPREGGDEEVLVDGNAMAEGHSYFQIAWVQHSPKHDLISYGVDDKGSEFYELRFRDVAGHELADAIPDVAGAEWANDGEHLFYARLDENHRPQSVYRHRLGTDVADDVLVYEEPDPGFFVSVSLTQSRRYILINAHDHQTSEVYLIDADDPATAPRLVEARTTGHEYSIEHHGDELIVLTNTDDAEDFKICAAPADTPDRAQWRDIEPHRPGRLILNVVAYADHLVRLEREDGLPRIVIRAAHTGEEHSIAFEEDAYSLGLSPGFEFDTTSTRFGYSSMTTPSQVYDYDLVSRERVLRKTQEVPSGHDPADYVTRRVMAPGYDGETIPVSLLYAKSTPLDGSAPLLLYGYGAYGIAIPAAFSTNCLSLVDRGFIYAIAHVRGGKEKGYRWYKEGRGSKKTNTFRDFISAGEYLASQEFTTRGNIVAHGGSAGGMLMGAVANMAPDLFLGIIAEVPFVDVLTTMLDDTLPLTPPEWPEWGNPLASREDYETIADYAPYEKVSAQAYPHILALAGLTDPRVTYWEPAKWVAKLREQKQGESALLLRTNMDAGHAGASGRFDRLKEVALSYAFALMISGRSAA